MFSQPCFIKKNTPELREKLKDLGHSICICTKFDGACWLVVNPNAPYTVYGIGYTSEEFPEKTTDNFLIEFTNYAEKSGIIDCEKNENLFLALAALNNENWLNQWIIIPKTKICRLPGYFPQTCGMDGHYFEVIGYDWMICKDPKMHIKIQQYIDDGEDKKILPRKASVQELIEYFKK